MRASSAFGGFLLLGGLITLVLKPVYNAGPLPQGPGVEATGPLRDIRPVPASAALLSVCAGVLLLGYSWMRRER
jgi:hypothetical protein